MKQLYRRLAKESVWYAEHHPTIRVIPNEWRHWLLDKGSLTERLVEFSGDNFTVKILSQHWAKPLAHEAAKLNISPHLVARVREVELLCDDVPVVFARSVMPLQMYLEQRHTLGNIGTRPLGQLLFRDGRMRVNKRSVALFSEHQKQPKYGRCTPYSYYGNEILVSEFFVSNLLVNQSMVLPSV